MRFNALISELGVADLARSLAFYRDLLDFQEVFAREEDGFHFLERESAQIMLVERSHLAWMAHGPDVPFGNGANFALEVSSLSPDWEERLLPHWFAAPFVHEYDVGGSLLKVRQLVVVDPDGYLVRLVCRRAGSEQV